MKTLLVVLTAAGLSGCAVYPAPAYDTYGGGAYGNTYGGGGGPYVVEQPPVYIQGDVYRSYPVPVPVPVYPRGYYRNPPPRPFYNNPPPRPDVRPPRPEMHAPRPEVRPPQPDVRPPRPDVRPQQPDVRPQQPGRGMRDRDGDGIPNRLDSDRDGNGIPNSLERGRGGGDGGRRGIELPGNTNRK